jgi:DNA repair exonuclease SbcCD ATPase subunit
MEHSLTLDWIASERRTLLEEQQKTQDEIEKVEQEVFSAEDADKLTLKTQNEAYREVQRIQAELAKLRVEHDRLSLSIADSAIFIRSLEQKISALSDADAVAKHLGDVHFTICPACLSPLPEHTDDNSCHLCHTPFDGRRGHDRIVAVINDAAIQLKQSKQLQEARDERLRSLEDQIAKLETQWQQASNRFNTVQRLPSTEAREKLRSLHRAAGYIERQIEDLVNKEGLVKLIDEVSVRKDALNSEINQLRTESERLRASQERQLSKAKTEIADEVRTLLRNDLRRQDSFENARAIQFGFDSNTITVDGHTYFSASSRVILKSSFFLGFFAAATKDASFRHPRFVMIDTIEDKGMEPERSHNFQNQILRVSREAKSENQVIYATAMISPDLDDEEFLVGRFYTRDEPTLAIG